ncbi:MAG TPA: amidohydrolase family protein [Methylomirabilota bacterium]|nr:amidohydrolase family protein [Methylomirabilota bacterium]
MQSRMLQLDPRDDVVIALTNLKKGETFQLNGRTHVLAADIAAKHKFAAKEFAPGDPIHMYGVMVGRASAPIHRGEVITAHTLRHDSAGYHEYAGPTGWQSPDISHWKEKSFLGYHRSGGEVGTRNYWLVALLVFCENRNLGVLKDAFEEELGFAQPQVYRRHVADLVKFHREGRTDEIQRRVLTEPESQGNRQKVFANVDGSIFLIRTQGCGGTREDARNLCGLIAGYIHHPNVAGATLLSLGCQIAQVSILREDFLRGIACLREFGFIYEILIYPQQLPAAVEFVQKFPEQPFVVDHMAKPLVKQREIASWSRQMRELAAAPNVCCKVSGLITEGDWKNWRPEVFHPYLDLVFEVFGWDRLLFRSDWPECLLAGSCRRVKGLVEDYVRGRPQSEKDNLFGGNAERFYSLKSVRTKAQKQ